MSENTLSSKHKNKVNLHDNSCHENDYITIDQAKQEIKQETINTKKIIDLLQHDDLKGVKKDVHVDWTKDTNKTIHHSNIDKKSILQYETEIDHDNLVNYEPKEHIDWTKEQSVSIPSENIEKIKHNELNNIQHTEHIDHSKVLIRAGNGLMGGGSIDTSRILHIRYATKEHMGGIKIGYGLETSTKDKKLNVDTDIFCIKKEIKISEDDWENISPNKYKFSIDFDGFPVIFCWDLKFNKVVYPEIKKQDDYILIFMKRKLDMLVKIIY